MSTSPDTWSKAPISQVVVKVDKIPKEWPKESEINYIDISSINNETFRVDTTKLFKLKDAPSRARQIINAEDILFSTVRPYLKNIAYVTSDKNNLIASTGFSVLRAGPELLSKYLFYYCTSDTFINSVSGKQYGVSYPAVKDSQVKEMVIDYPGIEQQQTIVSKIEELFSELDKGVEYLKQAQAQLKVYRQALLKHAFEGKLTEKWRAENNPESADKLLEEIKKKRVRLYEEKLKAWEEECKLAKAEGRKKPTKPKKQKEVEPLTPAEIADLPILPEGWRWVKVQELAGFESYSLSIGPFGSNLKVSDYRETGVPLVFVRNITKRDFKLNQKFVTDEKASELDAHSCESGDILITKMGDPPGDSTVYPDNLPKAIITADCVKFRPCSQVGIDFLQLAIESVLVKRQLGLITKGVAQKKISLARFRNVAIPVPSSAEQTHICNCLKGDLSSIDKAEQEIRSALAMSDRLKQSVLKAAFQGKLVN